MAAQLIHFILLIALIRSSAAELHKCCAEYEELNSDIKCVNSTDHSYPFTGLGIPINGGNNIPKCADGATLIDNSINFDGINVPADIDSCVDILDGYYKHLLCDNAQNMSNSESRVIEISNFYKCCDNEESYNIYLKECVPKEDDSFEKFLSDELKLNLVGVLDYGAPECDDVLVEYHSADHPIALEYSNNQMHLKFSEPSETFTAKDFCIDTVTNASLNANSSTANSKENASKWMAKICRPLSICGEIPCIRKCCEDGMNMNENHVCDSHQAHLKPNFHRLESGKIVGVEPLEYGVLHHLDCPEMYILSGTGNHFDEHFFNVVNGSLHFVNKNEVVDNDNYCVENFQQNSTTLTLTTFRCFSDDKVEPVKHMLYGIFLIISIVFLALTLVVLILLPNVNNVHGDALLYHIFSMIVASIALAIMKLAVLRRCLLLSYIMYIGFLSAFSWLNVMCFDIYWSCGTKGSRRMFWVSANPRLFRYYGAYAFGLPILLTIIVSCVDHFQLLSLNYLPHLGTLQCWFLHFGGAGHLIFFIGPVAIQLLLNIVLFSLTSFNYFKMEQQLQENSNNMNESSQRKFSDHRRKFSTISKLFLVMGISWLFEIIGTFYNKPVWVWFIFDSINMLQGVLVFFIFIAKKEVFVAILGALGFKSFAPVPGNTDEITVGINLPDIYKNSDADGGERLISP